MTGKDVCVALSAAGIGIGIVVIEHSGGVANRAIYIPLVISLLFNVAAMVAAHAVRKKGPAR